MSAILGVPQNAFESGVKLLVVNGLFGWCYGYKATPKLFYKMISDCSRNRLPCQHPLRSFNTLNMCPGDVSMLKEGHRSGDDIAGQLESVG